MKAAVIHRYGGPDELRYEECPDPVLLPDYVQTRATSINPIDLKMRSGAVKDRFPLSFPAILGVDISGTVADVGAGVKTFSIGDQVFGQAHSAYVTLCIVKADELAHVPPGLDLTGAAALPTVTTTGMQLADLALGTPSNATVLVLGAVGNVGRSAVHRLKERSARVIAGVLSSHTEDAQRLGADLVVALDVDKDVDAAPMVDAIADTVDGSTAAAVVRKLKPGGVFASVLGPPSNAAARPDVVIKTMQVKPDPATLVRMARAVQSRAFSIPIGESFPLNDAHAAHGAAEGGHSGKILLSA
jgi:NADPH:quinone reductase-like Zn-dependent oxidoreductase